MTLLDELTEGQARLPQDWLAQTRQASLARFSARGFPDRRQEAWKYTDLASVAERSADYLAREPGARPPAELPADHGDSHQILFLNGRLAPGQALPELPGLRIVPIGDAPAELRSQILARLAAVADADSQDLSDLNAAFLSDGLWVETATDARVEQPLEILYHSDGSPEASQPRIILQAGARSSITLIEEYAGTGAGLLNSVTDIELADSAELTWLKLQAESTTGIHVALQRIRLARDSRARLLQMELGGQLARNDLLVNLEAPGAELDLSGLFLADGNAHVDNHVRIMHAAPHTTSRETYRGIAAQGGRGIFNGQIIVAEGADGTDARLTNRNLLLSQDAEIDTKPELEIYADDVKCAHGATTGQLDKDALFYLRCRGIPESQARSLLIQAFAADVVERIPLLRLQRQVEAALSRRLARDALDAGTA